MTYQALVCEQLSPDLSGLALRTLARPTLGPDDVRIAIQAAGLNFPDLLMTQGGYQFKPQVPFVPGMEGVGTVIETGARVKAWKAGDNVRFGGKQGAFAEEIVAPAAALRPGIPELSVEEAASFRATAITAWVAFHRIGKLQRGETLLVHGARGGVGSACVQLGLHLGACVIASASNPAHLAPFAAQGVHTISAAPGFRQQVLELTGGRGADVIADPVGGDVFDESVRCIAWGGRLLVLGFTSGRIPSITANMPLIKGFSVMGVRAGEYGRRHPARGRADLKKIEALAAAGVLRPTIGASFPLAQAVQAFEALIGRQALGKIVITMGDATPGR